MNRGIPGVTGILTPNSLISWCTFFSFLELFPMAKSFVSDYVLPHKSPMEKFQRDHSKLPDNPSQISRESYVLTIYSQGAESSPRFKN